MRSKISIVIICMIIFSLTACTRYKNIVYLQDTDKSDSISSGFYPYKVPTYRIQQRDILYINIISMNREVTEVINTTTSNASNMYNSEVGFYINGYNVSDSGFIEIPIIGKVAVVGKTIEEAKTAITNQTLKFLKDPTVIVKLISFKYSVLGEVTRPGSYQNYNNQLTVLEAISQAGDISIYGNRRKVMVIRPGNNGTQTFRLNLTDKSILTQEGFFLLPNDIVYVEPVKSQNIRNNFPTITLFLTAVTTFILVLSYIGK